MFRSLDVLQLIKNNIIIQLVPLSRASKNIQGTLPKQKAGIGKRKLPKIIGLGGFAF